MSAIAAKTDNPFLEDFAAHAAELPGAGLPWLAARRAEAIKTVRAKGVPHRRIEEWKYTDLRSALEDESRGGVPQWRIEKLPDGVELFDLAKLDGGAPDWVKNSLGAIGDSNSMLAASLALSHGGAALRIPAATAIREPLNLAVSGTGHMRLLLVLEEGARLTLIEKQIDDTGLANVGFEIVLGTNAKLTHVRVAEAASDGVQVEEVAVRAERGAQYKAHFANFGAKLSRLELQVKLEGEGARANISGVSALSGNRHADITTHVDHAIGNTQSTQLFKKIAGGHSRTIYQGKVTVWPGANGSDSRQTAKGLLLGERAEIDLKPELEILADDVKCAHGAAVGDLDEDSLFYLQSRGIPESEARSLLIRAFLEEPIAEIDDEAIRASVWKMVEAALPAAMESAS